MSKTSTARNRLYIDRMTAKGQQRVLLWLPVAHVEKIDRIAKQHGITRNAWINAAIARDLPD